MVAGNWFSMLLLSSSSPDGIGSNGGSLEHSAVILFCTVAAILTLQFVKSISGALLTFMQIAGAFLCVVYLVWVFCFGLDAFESVYKNPGILASVFSRIVSKQ